MVEFPSPGRYDLAVVLSSLLLLLFGYVIYPVHLVQVSVWLTIFTISVAWMAFILYRLAFDTEW